LRKTLDSTQLFQTSVRNEVQAWNVAKDIKDKLKINDPKFTGTFNEIKRKALRTYVAVRKMVKFKSGNLVLSGKTLSGQTNERYYPETYSKRIHELADS